ncbi:MAG TPA: formyltransferase family protein [Bacteroidia bacterium]|nr:formyltransferase family protein [Bacteroidia bacterium]
MKLALLMNNNSYAGREYLKALRENNIYPDVISIGAYPPVSEGEEARCGGLWNPPAEEEVTEGMKVYQFSTLKDQALLDFLDKEKYDFAIQGGTGILKNPVISRFKNGILNFHPGDLPSYRGASAPEWQLVEKKPVVCTCHLIDEGIDTGPIIEKETLPVSKESYHAFRASVYPNTARFVARVIKQINGAGGLYVTPQVQDESQASYRKYIGDEKIAWIKENFKELV